MLAVSGTRRQRARNRMAAAAREYAAMGWPCSQGVRPLEDGTRACSCDRIGCPHPGAHPVSAAWRMHATTDSEVLTRWWTDRPDAGIILPTGRVFDVLDVPADAGAAALERTVRDDVALGPVAAFGDERHLFFVATRGAPIDEDEWWACHLDCFPETVAETPGVRWHCRDSYVLAPPSPLANGRGVRWLRSPRASARAGAGARGSGRATLPAPPVLPDPLRLLEILVDCM
ncbi:MAG TPA: bifunctional DNA primase/polymerase [Streptosporangiaceae bacterium]|nr:bifunctional DNA primase/polymerase [Streptosporangiaceae bacterium]